MICRNCNEEKQGKGLYCDGCRTEMPDGCGISSIKLVRGGIVQVINELKEQGLTIRKIAEKLNLSKDKVWRTLRQKCDNDVRQDSATSATKSATTTIANSATNKNPNVVPIATVINSTNSDTNNKSNTSVNSSTKEKETDHKPSVDGELFSAHHYGYSIRYEGVISEGETYYTGNKKKPYAYKLIKREKAIIEAKPKTITIWLKKAITGKSDNVTTLNKRARTIVIQELGELAERNRIAYNRESFKRISKPHLVIENEYINEYLRLTTKSEEKHKLAQEGIKIDDRSDPDKTEIDKQAEERSERMVWLLDKFPEQFAKQTYLLTRFSEQIELHLKATARWEAAANAIIEIAKTWKGELKK